MLRRSATVAFILLMFPSAPAATIVVAQDGSGDHLTIGAAVSAAQSGDVIRIRGGTYTELVDPAGLALTMQADDPQDQVVIEGAGLRRCLVCSSGEGVATQFSGLIFRGGWSEDDGGCVLIDGASPQFTDCWIDQGMASSGGGVCVRGGGAPTFSSTLISTCDADLRGGGIWISQGVVSVVNSVVYDNYAGDLGGGVAVTSGSMSIANTAIHANLAGDGGDGVSVDGSASLTIDDSVMCDHAAGFEVSGSINSSGGLTSGQWCCMGDVDWDGDVDEVDLTVFLNAWGSALITADDRQDVMRDADVDVVDLIELLKNWGACETYGISG